MQIIIDVPDGIYYFLMEHTDRQFPYATEWIRQGKPLPKGHGRLIDEKEILNNPDGIYYDLYDVPEYLEVCIPTVIEADKEVDE